MLACMEDPSPPVQRMGLAAFQHLATGERCISCMSCSQDARLQALLFRVSPLMLACMEDPSPPVQRMGLAGFQHLATGASQG